MAFFFFFKFSTSLQGDMFQVGLALLVVFTNFVISVLKRVRARHTAIEFFFNVRISTVTQQKALLFGACVHRRVSCDSVSMHPGFKPRDGARGQSLGHFCEVLLCCGKVFKCLYLDNQSSKKHSHLEHVYAHAIFIQVHGPPVFYK